MLRRSGAGSSSRPASAAARTAPGVAEWFVLILVVGIGILAAALGTVA
jgi:hypothetical protein